MKKILRKYELYLSPKHWLIVLRRQPSHMKHVYAALGAGLITAGLAALILYVDYGYWHEKYSRGEGDGTEPVAEEMVNVVSPGKMIGAFFQEASKKVKEIDLTVPEGILEGKDNYTKEEVDVQ